MTLTSDWVSSETFKGDKGEGRDRYKTGSGGGKVEDHKMHICNSTAVTFIGRAWHAWFNSMCRRYLVQVRFTGSCVISSALGDPGV